MARYIIRRLIQSIPIFFGITLLSFMLMAASGNPVAQLTFKPGAKPEERARVEAELGVNDPLHIQYLRWLLGDDWMRWDSDGDGVSDKSFLLALDVDGDGKAEAPGRRRGVLRGDFGVSFTKKRPVIDIIMERVPSTLELSISSFVIGTTIGITVGIVAAVRRGWFDQVTRVMAVALTAIPIFWFALMVLMLFSVQFRILPIGDRCAMTLADSCPPIWERFQYMILPVTVLSIGGVAGYSRVMRASMLDIVSQDYIRTAQAKGLSTRLVWYRHAARNAMIPIATSLGPAITFLISGAVVTETIFNYPGLGKTSIESVTQRDYPVVMALTIYAAVATILGYLLSDILYAVIDPRIRFS
ncbi:MAG: ABC transporter permease [Chloroflexi bacterium]|nr:ABC transporter permease [Chloroflexota bacterium]